MEERFIREGETLSGISRHYGTVDTRPACIGTLDRLLNRPDHPTIVMISHHLDELPQAVDQVVLLKGGRVFGDGPPATLLTSESLSRLWDCRVEVLRSNGRYVASVQER